MYGDEICGWFCFVFIGVVVSNCGVELKSVNYMEEYEGVNVC